MMNYLIFNHGLFNWDIWGANQYLPLSLSKKHRVVCFDHPTITNTINLFRTINIIENKNQKLQIFHTPAIIPKGQQVPFANFINYNLNFKIFNNYFDLQNKTIISFTPEIYVLKDKIKNNKIIYYVVDDYLSYPEWQGRIKKNNFIYFERRFLDICNIVIVSSLMLFEKYSKLHNNVIYFPNPSSTANYLRYHGDIKPDDLRTILQPLIGFIGNIDNNRIDFELIRKTASNYPKYSFVFIGPVRKNCFDQLDSLTRFKNIYLLGYKKKDLLPIYVSYFDVCIIPYKTTNFGKMCFPIKTFEYFAMGKPVVSSALSSLEHLSDNKSLYFAKNNDEFINFIDIALKEKNKTKRSKIRKEIAKKNEWDLKISDFIKLIK